MANRDLSNTPFSAPRLIIWGLFINLLMLVGGIIFLSAIDKEITPLGALAGGVIGYFTGKGMQKETTACGVCGTTAVYHTGEQCALGLASKLKQPAEYEKINSVPTT